MTALGEKRIRRDRRSRMRRLEAALRQAREALLSMGSAWVNGRQVASGIQRTVADQVSGALAAIDAALEE